MREAGCEWGAREGVVETVANRGACSLSDGAAITQMHSPVTVQGCDPALPVCFKRDQNSRSLCDISNVSNIGNLLKNKHKQTKHTKNQETSKNKSNVTPCGPSIYPGNLTWPAGGQPVCDLSGGHLLPSPQNCKVFQKQN